MDPNEALALLRRLAAMSPDPEQRSLSSEFKDEWETFATTFTGLDNWISRGGYLPQDWKR